MVRVRSAAELEGAFDERRRVAELALKHGLPTVHSSREYAEAGGLIAYGTNLAVKGAKPGDLPIEQPTKYDLIVNLKTAKALRLTIPQSILLRADASIE